MSRRSYDDPDDGLNDDFSVGCLSTLFFIAAVVTALMWFMARS